MSIENISLITSIKKVFPDAFGTGDSPMTHNDIMKMYGLREQQPYTLFQHINDFLREKGVEVLYANLEEVVETRIYHVDRNIKPGDQHHETCLSDGKRVWLHNDLEEVGGIVSRLYDILHVGCGHLWQWSADEQSGLQFYGNHAWETGSSFHLFASPETLFRVWEYEKEAGMIALGNLNEIMQGRKYTPELQRLFLRLFTDYMNTDLAYIIAYYKTGKVENFFSKWQFNSAPYPVEQQFFPILLRERNNKCISLISKRP